MITDVNIFMLSLDPKEAARWHVDRHVVKMVLESAQMLSTAHRFLDGIDGVLDGEVFVNGVLLTERRCYKSTHVNHPCAQWVRESAANYSWLYQLMIELDLERQHRFTPKLGRTIREHGEFLSAPPKNLPDVGLTAGRQAMPVELQGPDTVEAYRRYYYEGKQHLAQWTKRMVPPWFSHLELHRP